MTDDRTCPTCGHRPHQPGGCEARYRVTFEPGEPGEPCLCENWRAVTADQREDPATAPRMDTPMVDMPLERVVTVPTIEREAQEKQPAPLDVELRHVIETWDEVIGGVYSVTDDHLSVMADALEPIRARLSNQPPTEPQEPTDD